MRRHFLYYLKQQHHYYPSHSKLQSRHPYTPFLSTLTLPSREDLPLTRNTAKFSAHHIDSGLVFNSHLFFIRFFFLVWFMSVSLHSFREREIFNHFSISILYYPSLLLYTLCISEATRIGSKGRGFRLVGWLVGGRSARHGIYKGRVSRKEAKTLSQARVIISDQLARNEARQEVETRHIRQRDAQGTLRGKARCDTTRTQRLIV
ncbi:uncharacterized protein BDZ83DRAFT_427560 [Colletotrichum acutatum]|uniref:Uncharacterized protein n=1 Tax=Glomerella acutata TaxID=27357 RepID=A0AAD8UDV8_GLOAC|nr:uncharacterized protein BDZ83DRAFT_427560 [Colletotrichum acutatum]KAK1722357.1 hypothetical protein BDZ83DRAFT_427560 [Colletotrichum acutatum]